MSDIGHAIAAGLTSIAAGLTAIGAGLTDLKVIAGGLIGSILTACLSYIVQQKVAQSHRSEEEERLAFVYLVQITPFVAAEEVFKKMGEILGSAYGQFLQAELDKLRSSHKDLNNAQAWCALISAGIKEHMRIEGTNTPIWPGKYLADLKDISDLLDSYKIPLNLLSQMPKDAVVAYYEMQVALDGLKTVLKQWGAWDQSGGKESISAESLYAQWTRITAVSENAKTLREALIRKGNVSREKADDILRVSIRDGYLNTFGPMANSQRLKAAETLAQELLVEKTRKTDNSSDPKT